MTQEGLSRELPRELYWRSYTDPLTQAVFQSPTVRASAIVVSRREADFRPVYSGTNPLHYAIVVAPSGLAVEDSLFEKAKALIREREPLLDYLQGLPPRGEMCAQRGLAEAAASYELALGCTAFLKFKGSEIGSLAMRASWIYAEWSEREPGSQFGAEARIHRELLRGIALKQYLEAYEKEDLSGTKAGYAGVAYLIAELLREKGELDEAARWFGRVVRDKGASVEVLRLARNQMDLCQEQRHKRG